MDAAGQRRLRHKLAFDNFVQTNIDLHAAGTTALDIMLVSAKRGTVTLGDGNDHVTWVAHSNASGASAIPWPSRPAPATTWSR